MRLALTELRRARGRLFLPVLALGLVAFLAVALTALASGTERGTTGALGNSRTDVIVLASDAEGALERSRLDPAVAEAVEEVRGVQRSGPLGVFTGVADGPDGTFDMALLGFTPDRAGSPENLAEGRLPFPGEDGAAVVDTSLRSVGVRLGSQIIVQGSTRPVQVVGLVTGSRYRTLPAVWTSVSTWQSIVQEARPELGETVQAVAVTVVPDEEPARVADRINTTVPGVTASTTVETLESVPGGREQRQIRLWSVPVALVMAAVLTAWIVGTAARGREHLQALRVLGLRDRAVGGGMALQALAVWAGGLLLGGVLVGVATFGLPQELLVTPDPGTTALVVVAITVAALAGAAWAVRRILREQLFTTVLAGVPERGTGSQPRLPRSSPGSAPAGPPPAPGQDPGTHDDQPRLPRSSPGSAPPELPPAPGPDPGAHDDQPRLPRSSPGSAPPEPPPAPGPDPGAHDDQPQAQASGVPPTTTGNQPDDTRWYAGDDPTGEFPRVDQAEQPPAEDTRRWDHERWEP